MNQVYGWLERYGPAAAFALVFAAITFAGTAASAAAAASAALLTGGVVALLGAVPREGSPLTLPAGLAVGVLGVLFAELALSGALAANPTVSVFGLSGQRAGLALWIAAAVWLVASLLTATRGSLRMLLPVLAVAPGILGVLAVLEKLTASSNARIWGSAAGVLENSLTLGQILVLGTGATIAWMLISKAQIPRVIGGISLLGLLGGLVVASSRGAWLGLAVGALFALLAMWATTQRARAWLAWGTVGVSAALLALFGALAAGAFGAKAFSAVNSLSNQRLVIWRSAFRAAAEHPVLGRGFEQFSTWISWSLGNGAALSYYGAYDPHNVLLAILVGGGVVGLLLAFAVAGLFLARALEAFDTVGRQRFVAALLGTVIAVVSSAMLSWPSVAAFAGAAALLGTLIAIGSRTTPPAEKNVAVPAPQPRVSRPARARIAAALVAGVLGVGVGLACIPGVFADATFGKYSGSDASSAAVAALAAKSSDPTVGTRAMDLLLRDSASDPAALSTAFVLSTRFEKDGVWHVDTALKRLLVLQQQPNGGLWGDVVSAVDAGRKADPSSGIWDFVGAIEAQRFGKTAESEAYAKRALTFPLGSVERGIMETVAAGKPLQ